MAIDTPPMRMKVVIVEPLASRRETFYVLVALAVILLLMFVRFSFMGDEEAAQFIRTYQRLDNILTMPQRTVYQSLLTAVDEVVVLRDEEGQWPEAELLEMENLPPFDNTFLPAGLKGYIWTGHDGSSWVDYLGQDPDDKGGVSFILRLIDLHAEYHPHPHPGIDYDPNQKVAVQVWMFPEPARPYPGERLPEAGWWWVVGPNDPSLQAREETPAPTAAAEGGAP